MTDKYHTNYHNFRRLTQINPYLLPTQYETEIDRTTQIDYKAAAHELGQASPNAVRTALFEIKKKLRDGGAVIGSAEPDSPTAPKSTGGRKRKSPDQEPAKEKAKKVKTSEAKVADSDQDDTVQRSSVIVS